jgi:hypothetical protein
VNSLSFSSSFGNSIASASSSSNTHEKSTLHTDEHNEGYSSWTQDGSDADALKTKRKRKSRKHQRDEDCNVSQEQMEYLRSLPPPPPPSFDPDSIHANEMQRITEPIDEAERNALRERKRARMLPVVEEEQEEEETDKTPHANLDESIKSDFGEIEWVAW